MQTSAIANGQVYMQPCVPGPWIHMISINTNPSVQTLVNCTPFGIRTILAHVLLSYSLWKKKMEYAELYCFQKTSILL